MKLLRDGSDEGRTHAAGVLAKLASGDDAKAAVAAAAVVEAGALPLLVKLLRGSCTSGSCTSGGCTCSEIGKMYAACRGAGEPRKK